MLIRWSTQLVILQQVSYDTLSSYHTLIHTHHQQGDRESQIICIHGKERGGVGWGHAKGHFYHVDA